MKRTTKILSLVLVFVFLFSATFLISCEKPSNQDSTENVTEQNVSNYIIKTEIKDGCIWVTYSNDPANPVNIGALGVDGATRSESSLTYMPLANGTYGIAAGNARYLEEITIPETYNGKPVTAILENAFNGATNLKKITIPASITSVGDNAFFNCGNLEYNERDNALYLGNSENPYLILVKAKNSAITRCNLSDNTVAICDNAFFGCSELTAISIPDNVISIGSRAFYGCALLMSINFPEGTPAIGAETFYGCANLKKITIPASVTTIGESAFEKCATLTEVVFADNSTLKGIGNSAFNECKALKTIAIPSSVIYIGDNKASQAKNGVFYDCVALKSITFDKNSKLSEIGNFAFASCSALSTIELPDSVTILGHSTFRNSGLTEITLPASITIVADNTFFSCKKLETITFGNALTKIGYQAFASCSVLNNVIIPESTKYISFAAFDDKCSKLTSVTIKSPNGWYDLSTMQLVDAEVFSDPATTADKLINSISGFSK